MGDHLEATGSERADRPGDLAGETARGVLWTTLQKWTIKIGGFATIAILTRLLSPQDFGLVAVATALLPFIYLLSDFGFSTYVVQAERVDERMLSTAFWYSAISGLALACGFGLAATWISGWFGVEGLHAVLWGCAPAVLAVTLSSVPQALLKRAMRFRTLAMQSVLGAIAGQIVAVALAFTGFGVWALVGQLVVSQFIVGITAWVTAGWRPHLLFSRQEFVVLSKFGTKVLGVDLVALLRLWGETAIVGSVIGVAGLGYLATAQRLILVAQEMSAAAILPVSTVTFARLRKDPERLGNAYQRALSVMYAVLAPIMVFVAVGAPSIVPLVFGDGWALSIVPAQALAIAGILTLAASLDQALTVGCGRPGLWLVYAIAIDALTVATTAWTVRYGLSGVTIGFVGVATAATVVRWGLVRHLVPTALWRTLAAGFGRLAIVAAISGASGLLCMRATDDLPAIVQLMLTGMSVVGLHMLLVRLLLTTAYDTLLELMRRRLPRRLVVRLERAVA